MAQMVTGSPLLSPTFVQFVWLTTKHNPVMAAFLLSLHCCWMKARFYERVSEVSVLWKTVTTHKCWTSSQDEVNLVTLLWLCRSLCSCFSLLWQRTSSGVEVSLIVSHYLLLYFVTFSLFSYDEGSCSQQTFNASTVSVFICDKSWWFLSKVFHSLFAVSPKWSWWGKRHIVSFFRSDFLRFDRIRFHSVFTVFQIQLLLDVK